jgi:hypothetical protein
MPMQLPDAASRQPHVDPRYGVRDREVGLRFLPLIALRTCRFPKDAARVAVAVAETIAPAAVALDILRLEITICSRS